MGNLELTPEDFADSDEPDATRGPGLRFASAASTPQDRNEELKTVAFALIDAGLTVEHQNGDLLVTTPSGPVSLGPDGDRDLQITPETAEEIYWANFYAHTEYTSGSTFCAKIIEIEGIPVRVIDIGCGDGRDSYAFAATDRSVLGIDRSHIGVAHASRKAQRTRPPGGGPLRRLRRGRPGPTTGDLRSRTRRLGADNRNSSTPGSSCTPFLKTSRTA